MKKSHLLLAFLALLGFFFVSCADEIEDSKTYIVFSSGSRAAEKKAENLTDISFKGILGDIETLKKTYDKWEDLPNDIKIEKTYDKWSDAANDKIELDAGEWVFALSASLDDEFYYAQTSNSTESETETAESSDSEIEVQRIVLKTGADINSILTSIGSNATAFTHSSTAPTSTVGTLDNNGLIPVWLEGNTIKYYVPDNVILVLNADCSSLFKGMLYLKSIDVSKFDSSNVTIMNSMFSGCSALTTLDVSGFNTSRVTDMRYMFYDCKSLTELDVSGFNTSKVTDMSYMFYECNSLTELDVSGFNTSKVTDMRRMFYGCSALKKLDVSGFNTSNVTNMSYMFYNCKSLTTLDVSKFDTSNVTDMENMFSGCSALTELDVSKFNTSNVTTMKSMFYNCSALTELDVSGFNTSIVTGMDHMFYKCNSLKTIYAASNANWSSSSVSNSVSMFDGCENLVGGSGTSYDDEKTNATYARIDGGTDSDSPGYFTAKQ